MAQKKKDAKYLNVHLEREIYEKFEAFCKEYGYTKTAAVEKAISSFMDDVNKRMKTEVQADAK